MERILSVSTKLIKGTHSKPVFWKLKLEVFLMMFAFRAGLTLGQAGSHLARLCLCGILLTRLLRLEAIVKLRQIFRGGRK